MPTDPLQCVLAERNRQDAKWGVQDHADGRWFAIVGEEFGEVARALLESSDDGRAGERPFVQNADREDVRHELVQLVASGLAWLECMARREAPTDAD